MPLKKLTVDGLKKAIRRNSVVMYYADWCGHCRNAAPIYQEVANQVDAENTATSSPFLVTKFNMDKHGDVVQRLEVGKQLFGTSVHEDVKGFPTFICYKANGERSMYTGPRNTETMKNTFAAYFNS